MRHLITVEKIYLALHKRRLHLGSVGPTTTFVQQNQENKSTNERRSFPSVEGLNYLDLTFWALGGDTHWPESRGTLLYLFYAIPVIMQGKHGKSHPDKNLGSNAG